MQIGCSAPSIFIGAVLYFTSLGLIALCFVRSHSALFFLCFGYPVTFCFLIVLFYIVADDVHIGQAFVSFASCSSVAAVRLRFLLSRILFC